MITYSYTSRIDELINWFLKFDLDFACIYFDEPDHTGHEFGPDTQQYRDKVICIQQNIFKFN